MTVVDFESLDLGDRLGKGGQGSVHHVRNKRLNHQWAVVYKEYLPAVLPTVRFDPLKQMVDLVPSLAYTDGAWLTRDTSWPAALVEKNGQISGFLMRAVPAEFQFTFQPLGASMATQKLANFEFLLNPDAYVANIGLMISERDRLGLLAAVASTLDRLHGLGIAVGDLSPKNLLFSTSPEVKCFVIDCDAMRLGGKSVMEQVETPGWQIPTGEEKATPRSDAYKFGLLAIRLFARDQSSTDIGPLAQISPELGKLAHDSLSSDADRRPPLGDWIDELTIAASRASVVSVRFEMKLSEVAPLGSQLFASARSANRMAARSAQYHPKAGNRAVPQLPKVPLQGTRHVGLGRAPSGKLVALVVVVFMISMLITIL